MDKIKLSDVDLSSLRRLDNQGKTSTVYVGNSECIKMLDKLRLSDKQQLLVKLKEMDGLCVDGIIFPKTLIMDKGILVGYITDYFDGDCLYDYFTKERYVDANDILRATKKASLIVKNAHDKGIILQDISFDNVLIDENGNVRVCDIDSCSYKSNKGHYISGPLNYYYRYVMHKEPIIGENTDRQSMFLTMLVTMYHRNIKGLSDYDELSQKIVTLKNLRYIVQSMFLASNSWVPYLDDVIVDNDHFIIDRNKQVSMVKALKGDYSL